MVAPKIATRKAWFDARLALLEREKAFTQARDELTAARQALPWVKTMDYTFEQTTGPTTLSALFGDKSQLIVYHFMLGPDATTPCKSCSLWADNFERSRVHLAARDVALVAVSRAAPAKLAATAKRLGWTFPWLSSGKSTFNADFRVSFTEAEIKAKTADYNFGTGGWAGADMPGISVFAKDADGGLFHTYSVYARGLEDLNTTYRFLDIVPKGRDEGGKGMAWLKHWDTY